MTQAFNLSQLANKVNTSGQLDGATGLTGTITSSALNITGNSYLATSSGNVGIGNVGPLIKLHVSGRMGITDNSQTVPTPDNGSVPVFLISSNFSNGGGETSLWNTVSALTGGIRLQQVTGSGTYNDMVWFQKNLSLFYTSNTERMRITSGGFVGINNTNPSWLLTASNTGTSPRIAVEQTADVSADMITFRRNGSERGKIFISDSATVYQTSSDYRLKENITALTNGLETVAKLKPSSFTWVQERGGKQDTGFIAHELAEVFPNAVTSAKDAVDEEGNPVYQGIDTSFLVATLTAAIQEQQTIINDLKVRIKTLESKYQ